MNDETITLYQPIDTLTPVAPKLWIVDGPVVRMSFPGGSLPFPTRMVLARLRSGELWVHSPTELNAVLASEIDALGPVAHLVSPNFLHYAHIGSWSARWPGAVTWASPGVRQRASNQKIEVSFQQDLQDEAPAAWAEEIDQLIFRGSRILDEVVFFHRASRTLLLADLVMNFEPSRVQGLMRWLMKLGGAVDPDGGTPIDLRSTFWGQRDQARPCLRRMLAWDPERVIMAHGRWYPENGAEELRRDFRWLD